LPHPFVIAIDRGHSLSPTEAAYGELLHLFDGYLRAGLRKGMAFSWLIGAATSSRSVPISAAGVASSLLAEVEERGAEPGRPAPGCEGQPSCPPARARRSPVPAHRSPHSALQEPLQGPRRGRARVRSLEARLRNGPASRPWLGTCQPSRRPCNARPSVSGSRQSAGRSAGCVVGSHSI
jgi:hypothetical protein